MNATQMKAPYRALPSALQTRRLWGGGYNGVGERHAGLNASWRRVGKGVASALPPCGEGDVVRPTVRASARLIQSYTARLRTERLF